MLLFRLAEGTVAPGATVFAHVLKRKANSLGRLYVAKPEEWVTVPFQISDITFSRDDDNIVVTLSGWYEMFGRLIMADHVPVTNVFPDMESAQKALEQKKEEETV